MKRIFANKFFWTVTSCLLYFFLFSLLSRLLGLSFWQPDNESTLNLYAFQHSLERPDVVVMGSSRAYAGLSPSIIERQVFQKTGKRIRAFSIAQRGGAIRTDRVIIRDVLKGKKRPGLILLGVDTRGFNSNNHIQDEIYFKYYATQRDILSEDGSITLAELGWRAQGFIRDTSNLLRLVESSPWQSDHKEQLALLTKHHGAIPVERSVADLDGEELALMKSRLFSVRGEELKRYEIEGVADHAFKSIISLCDERNIKLVVVNMPVHPEFMDIYRNDERSRFLEYIVPACEHAHVEFANLQEEVALDDTEFWDLGHVNKYGAEIIGRYITEELLLPEMNDVLR